MQRESVTLSRSWGEVKGLCGSQGKPTLGVV